MTTPEPSLTRVPLDPALAPVAVWAAVAAQVRAWADARALSLRDAIVLLPFSALLPPARAAFAALGGWPPRIETPRTLAEASGPPPAAGEAPGGDATLDRLHAATLLAQSAFGADWQARDARGFRFAADAELHVARQTLGRMLLVDFLLGEARGDEEDAGVRGGHLAGGVLLADAQGHLRVPAAKVDEVGAELFRVAGGGSHGDEGEELGREAPEVAEEVAEALAPAVAALDAFGKIDLEPLRAARPS